MDIIGLTGAARSGKDTFASFLVENHGYKRLAFADTLREMVSLMTGLTPAELSDGALKETPIEWLGGKSPRQLMQTLGTEWGRDSVCPDVWLNIVAQRLRQARQEGFIGVVITDVRFDNEAEFIRSRGGWVVQIVRPSATPVAQHASERGISEDLIDETFVNDGSLRDVATAAFRVSAI